VEDSEEDDRPANMSEESDERFQVSLLEAMVRQPHICCLGSCPYGCCCAAHYYMRSAVNLHVPDERIQHDNIMVVTCCPGKVADTTRNVLKDKYKLIGFEGEERCIKGFETVMIFCACLPPCAGLDLLVSTCVGGCKLAQVNHEMKYRAKLNETTRTVINTMER
jgi:hypothetical protein